MSKYRITIITVNDEGISTTCVYVPTCAHMFEAQDKAMTYAKFQMDEEKGAYIKHISVSRMEEE